MALMTQPLAAKRTMLATPAAVGVARDLAGRACKSWGQEDQLDAAALVVSELVTNAVTAKPGGEIRIELFLLANGIGVQVFDQSPAEPVLQSFEPLDLSGRGLYIVTALTTARGVTSVDGGKVVWAVLPRT